MDRLKLRLALAAKALATFQEVLSQPKSAVIRDAAIKRFEYTFETLWKAGLDNSPARCGKAPGRLPCFAAVSDPPRLAYAPQYVAVRCQSPQHSVFFS